MIRLLWRWTTLPRWLAGGFAAGTIAVWFERLAWATAAHPDSAWRLTRALIGVAVLFALLVSAMSRKPQHSKGRKRPSRWHRGRSAARQWHTTDLPDVDSGADPTQPTPPVDARRNGTSGRRHRGDAL